MADPEEHPNGIVSIPGVTNHIGVATADHFHGGRDLELIEPAEGIAEILGPFKVFSICRRHHQRPQLPSNINRLPFEEFDDLFDHQAVRGDLLPSHTGCLAPADMVVEAGSFAPVAREIIGTRPDRKDSPDQGEGSAHQRNVGVGAKVASPGNVELAGDENPRKRLLHRHRDGWITLVVLEADVEPRLMFLDEIVFEQQRLSLIANHNGLDVGDEPGQQLVLERVRQITAEIAADPAS